MTSIPDTSPGEGSASDIKTRSFAGYLRLFVPRLLAVIAVASVVIWLFTTQHIVLDPVEIWTAIGETSPYGILLALALTALSFLAISLYDVVALRMFRHAIPTAFVARVGFTAVALGQMLGFGIVVATIVRWRHYRSYQLDFVRSGSVSAFIAISFLFALVQLLAIAGLVEADQVALATGISEYGIKLGSVACLIVGGIFLCLCYLQPKLKIFRVSVTFPRFRAVRLMFMLALLDVLPAACVLWILLPAGSDLSFAAMLPIFIAAMAMGLASNTPGGIGILELTFLMALPHVPPSDLLASLIIFRAVYYGIPFLLASLLLLENEWRTSNSTSVFPNSERRSNPFRSADVVRCSIKDGLPAPVGKILAIGTRAEDALVWLCDKEILLSRNRQTCAMFSDHGNSLVCLSDPIGQRIGWHQLLCRFEEEAKLRMADPIFYKVGTAFAGFLSRNGYSTSIIGHEAVLDVQSFTLDVPTRRDLRRKCRSASKAGVSFLFHPAGKADTSLLKPVSDQWLAMKGGRERGYSIGRFDPGYLAQFEILEARQGNETVAFISIQKSGDGTEWSIDLMRSGLAAPNGTMHALIVNAIELARSKNVHRLSLCSVAFAPLNQPSCMMERLSAFCYETRGEKSGLTGLYRFKQSFDPIWEPVYLATQTRSFPLSAVVSVRHLIENPT